MVKKNQVRFVLFLASFFIFLFFCYRFVSKKIERKEKETILIFVEFTDTNRDVLLIWEIEREKKNCFGSLLSSFFKAYLKARPIYVHLYSNEATSFLVVKRVEGACLLGLGLDSILKP